MTRATHAYLSLEKHQKKLPNIDATLEARIKEEEKWIDQHISSSFALDGSQEDDDQHPLAIRRTQRFEKTAPPTTDPNGLIDRPREYFVASSHVIPIHKLTRILSTMVHESADRSALYAATAADAHQCPAARR